MMKIIKYPDKEFLLIDDKDGALALLWRERNENKNNYNSGSNLLLLGYLIVDGS